MSESEFDLKQRPDLTAELDEVLKRRQEESFQSELDVVIRKIAVIAFGESIPAHQVIEEISTYLEPNNSLLNLGEVGYHAAEVVLRVQNELKAANKSENEIVNEVNPRLIEDMRFSMQRAVFELQGSGKFSLEAIDAILTEAFEKAKAELSLLG
jgi:hypothetical protein